MEMQQWNLFSNVALNIAVSNIYIENVTIEMQR
jgi:hypothetical protein